MTQITFQDGRVVLRDGKVGTGQDCCCEGGRCCGGYSNCQVTYTVTLSTGQVINGTGYLPVTFDQEVSDAVGGLDFSVYPLTINGQCRLVISWSTEYFCDLVDFDVVGFSAFRFYNISCAECCEKDPADTGYAYNCTLTETDGGTTQEPPCANGIELLGDHVTSVTIDSIVCDEAPCVDCSDLYCSWVWFAPTQTWLTDQECSAPCECPVEGPPGPPVGQEELYEEPCVSPPP